MVVRYSSANVGLSRFIIGSNKSINTLYYEVEANNVHLLTNRQFLSKPFLKLPNKQLAFNRRSFSTSRYNQQSLKRLPANIIKFPGFKLTIKNKRLFSSYKQLKNKFSEQKQQRKKQKTDKFIKWWTFTSIPLVFLGIFARYQYKQKQNKGEDSEEEVEVRPTSWKFFCYQALPLNAISRLWGKFNNIELPVWSRESGYKFYSYLFGVNLDEIKETDLKKFRNLSEFFYRELKENARIIDAKAEVVSPSDGKVLSLGIINENGEIEQVKGMNYSVNKFLGVTTEKEYKDKKLTSGGEEPPLKRVEHDIEEGHEVKHKEFAQINGISYTIDDLLGMNNDKDMHHFLKNINKKHRGDQAMDQSAAATKSKVNHLDMVEELSSGTPQSSLNKQLFYSVIYLAPGDYHRFHSPTSWVVQLRRYFTGELYSVAPYFQKTLANLFILNERVSLLGYWKHGFFSMTPVGATNVGSIKINFDKELVTNKVYDSTGQRLKKNTCYEATYFNSSRILGGFPLVKGAEMGGFELGSTVVLVFEAPKDFRFAVEGGQVVRMGQALGSSN